MEIKDYETSVVLLTVIDSDTGDPILVHNSPVAVGKQVSAILTPSVANVNEITELPELIIKTQTGYGAILKPQLKPRPPYQGDVKEVIDCVSWDKY